MLFGKKTSKGKYVKAKTPDARKRQKAAIVNYYIKKREQNNKKSK